MVEFRSLCCLFFLFYIVLQAVIAGDMVSRPLLPVQFHCHGPGDYDELTWLLDGVPLNESERQNRQITVTNTSIMNDTLSSDLTIIALPINDGIEIGCLVAMTSPRYTAYFNEMSLKIRGISVVRNVTLHFNTSSNDLFISWLPPAVYYPESISNSSNYTYQVIVFDEKGNFLLNFNDNSSSTFLEVANITKCDTFGVTVIAFLDQHTSNDSTIRNNGSYAEITFRMCPMHQNLIVELDYVPSSQSCPSLLSIDIESEAKNGTNHHESLVFSQKSDGRMNYTLSPFKHYQIAIMIENLQKGTKLYQNHTTFSTYEVQDFYVTNDASNELVTVQCLFDFKCDLELDPHNESTVQECYVVFLSSENEYNVTLRGSEEKLVELPASGNYTVMVYDKINNSIIGPSVENKQIQVFVDSFFDSISATSEIHAVSETLYITSEISTNSISESLYITSEISTNSISETPTKITPETPTTSNDGSFLICLLVGLAVGIIVIIIIVILKKVRLAEYRPQNMEPQNMEPQNIEPQNVEPQDVGPQNVGLQNMELEIMAATKSNSDEITEDTEL